MDADDDNDEFFCAAGSCSPLEDSWKMYAGSCYYVEPGASDNALTWRAARDWCRDLQAELVSITSLPEQLFVQSLVSNKDP